MDDARGKATILESARELTDEALREVIAALEEDLAGRVNRRKNEALMEIRRLIKNNELDYRVTRKRGRPRKISGA
ncbi:MULTISPECIES: hypothetical protein [unclassified Mesorhizobium]|uniref:hypothetical protein n=1 Tax=unclassified Mesorhizobium TaxID=325217 RepID=UPI002416E8E1|nr:MULTISPECIES: hypothetical protein [unclassified Mesorhizobium]MDG4901413.1 hypothetical protein [Mesorhizobium sp. WSM4962]MDG4918901.1 hypothetical protein [Mesorhizobium sp. WSM4989]